MLVLTRKKQEKIVIGKDIEIVIIDLDRGRVRIGIQAPRGTSIMRKELLDDKEKKT